MGLFEEFIKNCIIDCIEGSPAEEEWQTCLERREPERNQCLGCLLGQECEDVENAGG